MASEALTEDQSAFPIVHSNGVDSWTQQLGLSKRELFAAMAMQGMLANERVENSRGRVATAAVEMADDLLKELARG